MFPFPGNARPTVEVPGTDSFLALRVTTQFGLRKPIARTFYDNEVFELELSLKVVNGVWKIAPAPTFQSSKTSAQPLLVPHTREYFPPADDVFSRHATSDSYLALHSNIREILIPEGWNVAIFKQAAPTEVSGTLGNVLLENMGSVNLRHKPAFPGTVVTANNVVQLIRAQPEFAHSPTHWELNNVYTLDFQNNFEPGQQNIRANNSAFVDINASNVYLHLSSENLLELNIATTGNAEVVTKANSCSPVVSFRHQFSASMPTERYVALVDVNQIGTAFINNSRAAIREAFYNTTLRIPPANFSTSGHFQPAAFMQRNGLEQPLLLQTSSSADSPTTDPLLASQFVSHAQLRSTVVRQMKRPATRPDSHLRPDVDRFSAADFDASSKEVPVFHVTPNGVHQIDVPYERAQRALIKHFADTPESPSELGNSSSGWEL